MHTQAQPKPSKRFRSKPPTRQIHPADIKALIEKAGSSQAKIAHDLGCTGQHVNNVIQGRNSSKRIAEGIAKTVGLSLEDLWPGRYSGF